MPVGVSIAPANLHVTHLSTTTVLRRLLHPYSSCPA